MQLEAARAQAKATKKSGLFGGLGSAIGSIAGAMIMTSDSRMKKNVVEKAELANGVKLYSWEWSDAAKARGWDKGPTTGVIAQQVMQVKPESVYADKEGYLKVDYRGIEQ